MIENKDSNFEFNLSNSGQLIEAEITYRGERGPQGDIGPIGPAGPVGPSTNIGIGTVEKGDEALASITGVSPNQILNLVLPKGDKGDPGPAGPVGPSTNIGIGTVEKGDEALASITGVSPNQILNLVLPKGDKGDPGPQGPKPIKGVDYFTDDDINFLNISKKISELEDDLGVSDLMYNLITNGSAVKTGRKVDGKDEWVIKKSAATIKDDNKRISMGLPTNARQIDYDVQIASIHSDGVIVKPGYYKSSTDFFMAHGYSNGDVQVQTGSGVQWLNSDMKYFITVYYVLNEV